MATMKTLSHRMQRFLMGLAPMVLCCTTGCVSSMGIATPWENLTKKDELPKDSHVLTGGRGLQRDPIDPAEKQELDNAIRVFEDKKYAEAEVQFHKLVRSHSEARWWEI